MVGVHLKYNKLTRRSKIVKVLLPKKVVIPLTQHIGAPNISQVKVGDDVKTGQVIGKNDSFVSSYTHASISGKVIDISEQFTSLGIKAKCVTIQSDGKDEWIKLESFKNLDKKEQIQKIKELGIVGQGGATFPTHVKLSTPNDKKINTIIVNGAECEPYLTCDNRIMIEKGEKVLNGLKIVMDITDCKEAIIGIENNKPNAIRNLTKLAKHHFGVKIQKLETMYPQGAEKILIHSLIDKWVPPGGLPLDVGCIVLNVGTLVAINDGIMEGKPLIERVITITGDVNVKKNALVRVGTLFEDLIVSCEGYTAQPKQLISGGPMMGISQFTELVPVMKGTSGLLVLNEYDENDFIENPCIKCAKCVDACPMNLLPLSIARNSKLGNYDVCKEMNAMDCFECGSCAFSCPSKIPLVQLIKDAKTRLMKK